MLAITWSPDLHKVVKEMKAFDPNMMNHSTLSESESRLVEKTFTNKSKLQKVENKWA